MKTSCCKKKSSGACKPIHEHVVLLFAAIAVTMFGVATIPLLGYSQTTYQSPNMLNSKPNDLIVYCDPVKNNWFMRGQNDAMIINHCFLTSAGKTITVKRMNVSLNGIGNLRGGGAPLVGSSGGRYFSDIKIINEITSSTLMRPVDPFWIGAPTAPSSTYLMTTSSIILTDRVTISAGMTIPIAVTADFAGREDVVGQFFGRRYLARFAPLTAADVCFSDARGTCLADVTPVLIKTGGIMTNTIVVN